MGPDSQETRATHCYTDEWLQKLDGEWVKISHLVKTQMLVPILLTQTLSILIDGNPIIEDFMVKMKEKPCSLPLYPSLSLYLLLYFLLLH